MYERRRLERRLRDKEAAYQEVCVHPDVVQMTPVALLHHCDLIPCQNINSIGAGRLYETLLLLRFG